MSTSITVRFAAPADAPALADLAALDSSAPLRGDVLVVSEGGRPLAALSLADDAVVADPFARTAAAVEVLRLRAAQLAGAARRPRAVRFRQLAGLPAG